MHFALLLWSLLAVVPIISATPTRSGPAPRASPTFVSSVIMPDGSIYDSGGCRKFGALSYPETPLQGGTDLMTVQSCIFTCWTLDYNQGGVSDTRCFCDNDTDGGPSTGKGACEASTCLGNGEEYCGSTATLIFYSLRVEN